jgi:DNA polymerase III gamma/tau subunit
MELYKRLRPQSLDEIYGQKEAVSILKDFLKRNDVPQTILFSGPSGCGKTTMARILRKELNCGDADFYEVDCADRASIDMVRELKRASNMMPLDGPCKVWILDEVQSLSRVSFAQQAMLKLLEDTPKCVYFFLATTDPSKLHEAIKTRCTKIKVNSLTPGQIEQLIKSVCKAERAKIGQGVIDKIAESASGSAREALVLLGSVIGLADDAAREEAIQRSSSQSVAFDLVKAMLWGRAKWPDVAKIVAGIDAEPENMRRLILKCATTELLKANGNAARAAAIINRFEGNFFDGGMSSLVLACYDVIAGK